MALRLGGYCKAYPVFRLRAYAGWVAHASRQYADDHVLYLHEDFSVTDGVYAGQDVVFDLRSEEWLEFCRQELKFLLHLGRP